MRWAVRVEPRSDSQCAGHMARRKVVFETWGGRGEGGEWRGGGVWKAGSVGLEKIKGVWGGLERCRV